ncbi:hypothetical protein FACS1894152_8340 [Bacilli bacterium]|nr:hypothetical protein FACS1894152_8340 [Bacilli bacterium]
MANVTHRPSEINVVNMPSIPHTEIPYNRNVNYDNPANDGRANITEDTNVEDDAVKKENELLAQKIKEQKKILRKKIETVLEILKNLGYCIIENEDMLNLSVPFFRGSILYEEDIIDDIIRIYGYNHLEDGDFVDPKVYERENNLFHRKFETGLYKIRSKLANNGMVELVTYPFMKKENAGYFSEVNDELDVINPIISDFSHMRPNMPMISKISFFAS